MRMGILVAHREPSRGRREELSNYPSEEYGNLAIPTGIV